MPTKKQTVNARGGQSSFGKKAMVLSVLLVVSGGIALLAAKGSVAERVAMVVAPQSEHATELYIPAPGSLSTTSSLTKKVEPGHAATIPLVIGNHEGRTTTYTYEAGIAKRNKQGGLASAALLQRGTLTLEAGRESPFHIDFTAPVTTGDYLVTVRLQGRSETIHYTLGVEK